MELALEKEGKTDLQIETVKKRLNNNDGTPIGVSNKNPILNTIRMSKSYILLN